MAPEECSRRHLDVVSKLEILRVGDALKHGHAAEVLESHEGERETGLHIREDELGEDVEADLDICDSLDHANWYHPHNGDENSDDVRPPGKVSWITKNYTEAQNEHNKEHNAEPPFGCFLVLLHELHVDVIFLIASSLGAIPDLLPVEEAGVDDDGYDGCEAEAVLETKGG